MLKLFNTTHWRIWSMLELLHGFAACVRHQGLIRRAILAKDAGKLKHGHAKLHIGLDKSKP